MRPQDRNRKLFHRAHYNILAKQFREQLTPLFEAQDYYASAPEEAYQERVGNMVRVENPRTQLDKVMLQSQSLINLAMALANRFALDNEDFKPEVWLEAISPDSEKYPLHELWSGMDTTEVEV